MRRPLLAAPATYRGKDVVFWSVTLGGMNQTADQLPDPSVRFVANPHLTGKNGGYTLNLHQFARNGVVLLGHLVDVRDNTIALAPDLREIWPSPTRDRTISKTMSMRLSEKRHGRPRRATRPDR